MLPCHTVPCQALISLQFVAQQPGHVHALTLHFTSSDTKHVREWRMAYFIIKCSRIASEKVTSHCVYVRSINTSVNCCEILNLRQ